MSLLDSILFGFAAARGLVERAVMMGEFSRLGLIRNTSKAKEAREAKEAKARQSRQY